MAWNMHTNITQVLLILSVSQVQVNLTGPEDKHDRKEGSAISPAVITSGNRNVNTWYCHSRLLGKLKHVINIDRETDCLCIFFVGVGLCLCLC